MFTYLIINTCIIFFPFILSFDKKVNFSGKWKYAFLAIIPTAVFFILWDYLFTDWGIWKFNPDYVVGFYYLNLPVEEWMFFITVPFALLFIYEVVKHYFSLKKYQSAARKALIALIPVSFGMAALFSSKTYTFTIFLFLGIFLGYAILSKIFRNYASFLAAFFLSIIPFLIFNGFLTGLPVVEYNKMEILNLHLGSIPIEDLFYNFLLFGINVIIYESILEFVEKRVTDPRRLIN